jgi:type I restriction enzyme S subunit
MMTTTKNTKAFYKTEIPSDWENTELGKKLDVLTGFAFPSDKFSESGVKLLRGSNVKRNQVDWKEDITRYWPYDSSLQKFELKVDDLVIALDGALIGRSFAKIKEDDLPAYLVQRVARLRGKGIDQLFLHTLFTQRSFELHVDSVKTHTAIPHISPTDIKKFRVNIPPLPEQKAIAQVLSTADAAIHTTEKIIAQKELRKKWLMQQLLTGKKRLKGFSGEWRKLSAGEIFKSITKKGFADEELLSATQDRGMIPRTMLEGRVTMPTSGTEGFKLVEIGDFIISLRSFQGGLEYSYYRGLVSPAYTVLKPKKPINDEFYKQYFKSYEFIGRLATAVIGIRDGKQISYDDFCIVKIPHPTIEEQTAIAQVLQAADKEISLLKAKAEKLREQKKGLMQVLLTGKVRLKINE